MSSFARLLAVMLAGAANVAAMPIQLVSNRATYDVRLEHTSPGGAVAGRGRMVIQFRDTCDGWSTAQRMVADLTDADGAISRTDFLVTAWESKDGKSMRFDVKSASGSKRKEKRGTAMIGADGRVTVTLLSPTRRQFTLPAGTLFPSTQVLDLVRAATRGEGMVRRMVFQGGDENDYFISTAVIGRAAPLQATAAERAVDRGGLLHNVTAWTTLVSYFANRRGADLPEYEVASRLYANGVSGSMSLIYTRYALRATLTHLEPVLPSCSPDDISLAPSGGDSGKRGR